MIAKSQPKFSLGKILATPGALEALQKAGQTASEFLQRHAQSDWGDVCEERRTTKPDKPQRTTENFCYNEDRLPPDWYAPTAIPGGRIMVSRKSGLFQRILLAGGLLVVLGCPAEPPSTDTAADIERLPISTKSLWARRLPDSAIPALARLQQLDDLNFMAGCAVEDAPITDVGLARLSTLNLPNLETLALGYCDNITDAGLAHVGKMESVTLLILRACPHVTDEGLAHLVSMKKLTYLDLMGCPGVTDRGLERLMSKTNWTNLLLSGCPHVTAGGVAKLRIKLPKARIEFDEKQWELNRCVRSGH